MGYGEVTRTILEALEKKGAANPGDIVAETGLPRYLVLAAFHVLHELGMIELIYSKGSHKVYRISEKGREYLHSEMITGGENLEAIEAA